MYKKGIFELGIVTMTLILIIISTTFIVRDNNTNRNDKVGELSLEIINNEIKHNAQILYKDVIIDKKVKEFFILGGTLKDSYKIGSDGIRYRLWSKKINNEIISCYPDNVELLRDFAKYTDAEEIKIENQETIFIYKQYSMNKKKVDGIINYDFNYNKEIIIKRNYSEIILKANEFFEKINECKLNENCYIALGGIKESDSTFRFNVDLSDDIILKGIVSLDSGNPLGEKFEC